MARKWVFGIAASLGALTAAGSPGGSSSGKFDCCPQQHVRNRRCPWLRRRRPVHQIPPDVGHRGSGIHEPAARPPKEGGRFRTLSHWPPTRQLHRDRVRSELERGLATVWATPEHHPESGRGGPHPAHLGLRSLISQGCSSRTCPVTIKGTNLLGASSVTFNGLSGTITKDGATKIKVKVPIGATNGLSKVSTPGGNVESATAFNVT